MEPRARKGERTRARIVAEAAAIFNQRGFDGASMQDILDACSLEKGGLYRHFHSKQELAIEAFRFALAHSQRLRTDKLDRSHGALEHLRSIVSRFVDAPTALPGGCPLMNTAVDADDGNEALRALAREGFSDWKERIARVVERGIENGEISLDTQPERVATMIVASLEGALMLSRLEGTQRALSDVRFALYSYLDGIRAT